ncbi:PAS domain S-box protein [Sulfurimonas sp.]
MTNIYSKNKFQLLFENSPIGMSLVDQETGHFLEVNQSLLDSTGYTREELLALSFLDLTPQEYETQEQQKNKDLNNYGKFGPYEKEYIKKDGSHFYIQISGFSLIDENGKKVVWNLIEDIHQKKQYEIIYKDNKELLEYISIENNLQNILDKIVNLAEIRNPSVKCSILLLDKSGKHLINGSAPSLPDFYNEAVNGIAIGDKVGSCGSAAFNKKRVFVDNIDIHENWQPFLELTNKANLHACWSEPIISSSNEVLGTFAIYNEEVKHPNEFELKLIETYANTISKAIEKHNYTEIIFDNQNKLEQLFNNSQSGLLYIDENRLLIKANQRFADILGYETTEEMIGFSMEAFHLNHERFIEFGKNNFATLITKHKNFNIEYELKKQDGSVIWCEMAGKALDSNIPADLSKGVLWTINDISLRKKYELEFKEKQILLKSILTTIPDMIWMKNIQGVYLACNSEFESFFGADEVDIIGKTDYDFVDKELADFFRLHDKKALDSDKVLVNEEWVTYNSNNKNVLLDTSKTAIRNSKNEPIGVLGIGHDVTKRHEKEVELQEANKLAQSLTSSQQVLLSLFDKGDSVLFKWNNDENWSVSYVSESVGRLLGYRQDEFKKNNILYSSCIYQDDLKQVIEEVTQASQSGEQFIKHEPYRVVTKNKEIKWVLDYTAIQKDDEGNITHYIGYISDISKMQEAFVKVESKAYVDELTGIDNRNKFDELLDKELKRLKRYNRPLSIAIIDIDKFKNFNDTFGHLIGDEVLITMAQTVKNNVRETDEFARWGGEEFIIMFIDTPVDLARTIAESLKDKIEENRHPTAGKITASFGITEYKSGDTHNTLFKRCDDALYKAKENGRNRVEVFSD